MDASLDTNVIIHLYTANLQSILFSRFNKLIVYEFIRNQELERHANAPVIAAFDQDVATGKIELVTDDSLRSIGMHNIFQNHVRELRRLFDGSDLGEVYAIALAKTLGCVSLVTDDIKERGPHYTLMRMQDSDVIPFAFYELLFLDYLEGKLTEQAVLDNFNAINELSQLNMGCSSKLKSFIRRFWHDPYTAREKAWITSFCTQNGISARNKLRALSTFLS
ncbi:hypothetical protein [Sporomusa aerivorans]|uniref:hypothetical protein n=1 Tax=Sporomusa aerivorans TaxID=204936 RepID=UPI00352ABE58